jgi:hypothetical protein
LVKVDSTLIGPRETRARFSVKIGGGVLLAASTQDVGERIVWNLGSRRCEFVEINRKLANFGYTSPRKHQVQV